MADALLSSIVTEIVKKLGSVAYEQIQSVCSFETEFGKMKDTISTVQAVLLDMQEHGVTGQHERGTNHQASVWFEKLKDVVEDADDLLDDFSTEDLRRKAMMTSNKKAKKVRIFFSSSNQLFFRLKMSRKVKVIRETLDAIAKWMSSLSNLVEISLLECKGCEHLPNFEQLPCLRSLVLDRLNSVKYIDDDRCGVNESSSSSRETTTTTFFPSLKYLKLKDMPNLMGWWRSNQAEAPQLLLPSFPCLVESEIFQCPKLTSMPLQPTVVKLEFNKVSEKLIQQQLLMLMARATSMSSSSLVPLSKLEELKILAIKDLVTLPEEAFRLLTSLMKLKIWECPRLTSLSGGMRHLTALTSLDISNCHKLDLSDGDDDGMHFQGLSNLTSLNIDYIPKLESLPAGLQHVTTLQHLSIEGCGNLKSLQEWTGNLTSLQQLQISHCHKLDGDDDGMHFQGLSNLTSLAISSCENLKSLPEWTGNLTSLQHLRIDYCPRLKSLPEGMRRLTALETLTIRYCSEELKHRCQKETGEDWPKIAHIPQLAILSVPERWRELYDRL